MKGLVAAAPWVTVMILLALFWVVGSALSPTKGMLVDLPETQMGDGDVTGPVALIVQTAHETLVFFDDARYLLGDSDSTTALGEHLSEVMDNAGNKALLALADCRVSGGELMKFAELARKSGVPRVLFAEKRQEADL